MEETGAAAAIEKIVEVIEDAAGPQTVPVDVPDGAGGTRRIEVLVHEGEVVGLQEAIRAGAKLVRELRAKEAAPPGWRDGTAAHQSLASFIEHIERFKKDGESAVWANPLGRRLVSVLDYHRQGADSPAAWGRHRGTYDCPLSESWSAWGGENGLKLSQEAFADLLDSRDYELASGRFPRRGEAQAPAPASLVTLANNLEVYSTATAKRERDVNTGRIKLSYSEDKGVSGTLMPPPAFLIGIRVFEDSPARPIEIRLRGTVEDSRAVFQLGIHGAKEVLREAFDEVCGMVENETGVPIFCGAPETGA